MYNPNNNKIESGFKVESELIAKWSELVMEDGFTAIPNLLIDHLVDLQINPVELSVIIAIERHRFFRGTAWPSNQRIGDLLGYDPRSVSRVTSELHQRNLLNKIERQGRSNLYDLEPLVKELEYLKGKPHPNKVYEV
jgi:DNA-binding MarR family transcriptional regulator